MHVYVYCVPFFFLSFAEYLWGTKIFGTHTNRWMRIWTKKDKQNQARNFLKGEI